MTTRPACVFEADRGAKEVSPGGTAEARELADKAMEPDLTEPRTMLPVRTEQGKEKERKEENGGGENRGMVRSIREDTGRG